MTEKEREIYRKVGCERMQEIAKILDVVSDLMADMKLNNMEKALFFHGLMAAGMKWEIDSINANAPKTPGLN